MDSLPTSTPGYKRALLHPEQNRQEYLANLRRQQEKIKAGANTEVSVPRAEEKTESKRADASGSSKVFYCKTCEVNLKDSQAYIDHINGKSHNNRLGMSMVVERVGVDRVRDKLQQLKQ